MKRMDPKVRLICLPYAGAAAAVYRIWGSELPEEIEVYAAQLPGKGWRMREQPLDDLNAMADRVVDAVVAEVSGTLAVFGHSMGAWLGLEVVRRLEAVGRDPLWFFASGRQGPSLGHTHPPIGHLDDHAFVTAVDKRYGGIPSDILANADVLQLLLPALRADFVALESFKPVVGNPVRTPILAMRGDTDPLVPDDHLPPWAEATSGPFRTQRFPGGHFYFSDDPRPLLRTLILALEDALTLHPGGGQGRG